jgi:hypothetical protein
VQPHDPFVHYRARIEAAASDRQALADIHLELQLASDLDHDEEHALQAHISELLEGTGGWGDLLPSALEPCPYCGKVRDRRPGGRVSNCLCAGIPCRRCHAGRVHRPISDHYEPDDHRLWHAPSFGQYAECHRCQETSDDAELLAHVRIAAERLAIRHVAYGDPLPRHNLVALHGDVEQWHALRLGAPPDGRPLYVGRSLAGLTFAGPTQRLRIAAWRCPWPAAERDRVLGELLVRWRPPLNQEIATPWSSPRGSRSTACP